MLKYIELKTGFADNGPAWIARVKLSKSGRTVYFNGHALKRAGGGLPGGNQYDLATGQAYWVSGGAPGSPIRRDSCAMVISVGMSAPTSNEDMDAMFQPRPHGAIAVVPPKCKSTSARRQSQLFALMPSFLS